MSTVKFTGQAITGFWLSTTVTRKEHVAELPAASLAVAVTVVAPSEKKLPEAGLKVTVAEQLSVAVAENVTAAPHWPLAALTVRLAGQTIVGRMLSTTVTEKVQVVELPEASVAVAVTTVVPTEKLVLEALL
jgi:hypothetical protein